MCGNDNIMTGRSSGYWHVNGAKTYDDRLPIAGSRRCNGTPMRARDTFALRHRAGVDVLQQLTVVGPTGAISDLSKKMVLKGRTW